MSGTWITLYDICRDGGGSFPWFQTLSPIITVLVMASVLRNKQVKWSKALQWSLRVATISMAVAAMLQMWVCFYEPFANRRAITNGRCEVTEGSIGSWGVEDYRSSRTGYFEVGERIFSYSNRTYGGMSSSEHLPWLQKGMRVRVWSRGVYICRLDAFTENAARSTAATAPSSPQK